MTTNINTTDAQKKGKSQGHTHPNCRPRVGRVGSLADRYWRKVITGDGCWGWSAFIDRKGYGRISLAPGLPPGNAHRVSWEIHFGPIPQGMCVLHKCDNPVCSNPEHLWLGTQQENLQDRDRKGRLVAGIRRAQDRRKALQQEGR